MVSSPPVIREVSGNGFSPSFASQLFSFHPRGFFSDLSMEGVSYAFRFFPGSISSFFLWYTTSCPCPSSFPARSGLIFLFLYACFPAVFLAFLMTFPGICLRTPELSLPLARQTSCFPPVHVTPTFLKLSALFLRALLWLPPSPRSAVIVFGGLLRAFPGFSYFFLGLARLLPSRRLIWRTVG